MNLNLNPKVIAAALAAALVGALAGATASLQSGAPTTKALLIGVGVGFLSGAASGLAGWVQAQGGWAPVAAVTFTPPTAPPAA